MVLVGKLAIAASAQLRVRRQAGEEEEEEEEEEASDLVLVVVTIDGMKVYDTKREEIQRNRKIPANSNI